MESIKIFYIFADPFGSIDCKIGITSHPAVRLGVYQNSYSRKSHIACFNTVYIGPNGAISNLEKAVKIKFDWNIERDGRGSSEWISTNYEEIEKSIDDLILGYRFKVIKAPTELLPLTCDNLHIFFNWLENNAQTFNG